MSSKPIFDKNYFELFGLKTQFKQDNVEIRKHYLMLQSNFHPDNVANHSSYEKQYFLQISTLINDAYQVLTSPLKRAQYLLSCLKSLRPTEEIPEEKATTDNTLFLMEQMSLREEIEELKAAPDSSALAIFKMKSSKVQSEYERSLSDSFEQLETASQSQQINIIQQEIDRIIFELQFYLKLDEELKNI